MPGQAVSLGTSYTSGMWTRTQVARYLGKSIATVRRMEGVVLHPWVDDSGVHRFDPDEIHAFGERASTAFVPEAHSSWFHDRVGRDREAAERRDDQAAEAQADLQKRLSDLERELAQARHLLREAHDRERALIRCHRAARLAIVDEVNHFVERLSPSQLGRWNVSRLIDLIRSLQSIDAASGESNAATE